VWAIHRQRMMELELPDLAAALAVPPAGQGSTHYQRAEEKGAANKRCVPLTCTCMLAHRQQP